MLDLQKKGIEKRFDKTFVWYSVPSTNLVSDYWMNKWKTENSGVEEWGGNADNYNWAIKIKIKKTKKQLKLGEKKEKLKITLEVNLLYML